MYLIRKNIILPMLWIGSISLVQAGHEADAAAGPESPAHRTLTYTLTDEAVEELLKAGVSDQCSLIAFPMWDCLENLAAEYGKFLLGTISIPLCAIDYTGRKIWTTRLKGAECVNYRGTLMLVWPDSNGAYCNQVYKVSKDCGTRLHLEPYVVQTQIPL